MAATLAADQEQLVFYSFPITKQEETEAVNPVDGTPDIWILGKATDGTLDGDGEIVDPEWSAKALQQWADTGANLRMSHDPKRPVGKGHQVHVMADGNWVKALVCDPLAKHFIRNGVLNDYSVGISNPDFKYRDQKLDPLGKARRIITGREDGTSRIAELSVVDRGSNFNSKFTVVRKSAGSGEGDELVGEMTGDPAEIAKAAPATLVKASGIGADDGLVNVDLPKGATVSVSPADLAKLRTLGQRLAAEQAAPDPLEAVKAAEAQVYKRDIDTATRRRLAGQGRALSNLSYPVETHEDADNAVTLILSGHGDTAAAAKMVRRIARKEKWQDILDRLDGKKGGGDEASKGADVTAQQNAPAPPSRIGLGEALNQPGLTVKADPGDEDGDGAMHHDDGQDDDTDSDADALDKAAAPTGKPKVPCGSCGKKCKPSAKFCPGCGKPMGSASKAAQPVTGSAVPDVQPVPEHREPDGPAVEALEHDAHLPTVPDSDADCEMKAATRHSTLGVPYDAGWLHDALCPAYAPADVAKHYPRRDLSLVDEAAWLDAALDIAAKAPLEQARTKNAMDLWAHARVLKALPPDLAGDLAIEAHKAFRDANPGPGSAPTPGEISPQRFSRPYITAGHAAPSPGHDGPNTAPIHPGHVSASDFRRDLITVGHQASSPGDSGHTAPPPPGVPGVPSAVPYAGLQRDNAAQARSAMHDHIAMTFPDLCPMYGPGHAGQPPSAARPVPAGVGAPVPHGAGKAAEGTGGQEGTASGKAARRKLRRKLEKAVLSGDIHIDKAREQLGLQPLGYPVAATAETVQLEPAALKASGLGALTAAVDPDVIKAAVAEATSPLAADLAAARTEIAEIKTLADAMADDPDPRVQAYRGPVLSKTSGAAVPQPDARGYEDRVRANVLTAMYDQWRNSSDPGPREEAWQFLLKEAGIDLTKST